MLSIDKKKLPYDLNNRCRTENVEKCLINKYWLIEYNRLRSHSIIHELLKNGKEINI